MGQGAVRRRKKKVKAIGQRAKALLNEMLEKIAKDTINCAKKTAEIGLEEIERDAEKAIWNNKIEDFEARLNERISELAEDCLLIEIQEALK